MTMKKHKEYIDTVFQLARAVDPVFRARTAACIVYKNKIISYGYCHNKTHPFQTRYAKNPDAVYFHAEVHAIKNALNVISVDELRRATIYIARMKYDDNGKQIYGLSKPCDGCARCIEEFDLERIVYTANGSEFLVEDHRGAKIHGD